MSIHWGKMISSPTVRVGPEELEEIVAEGFDRVQPEVGSIMDLTNEEIRALKERMTRIGLIPEVWSAPLPAGAYVTQRGFNIYAWTEYLKKAVHRIADLGCTKLAWSDGRARVLPLEGDLSGIKEQVLQFLYLLCEIADNNGITILVEPLGPRRTNFLNKMEEIRDFLPLVGKDNISSLISFRELSKIDLEAKALQKHRSLISHVQMENPTEEGGPRQPPLPNDGIDYKSFLEGLWSFKYDGLITLPETAGRDSLEFCRSLWDSLD